MASDNQCFESSRIDGAYRVWCPSLDETVETAATVEGLDEDEAAESYADHLIFERRVIPIGSTILVRVSTGQPGTRDRAFEVETFYRPDFQTRPIEP